MRDWLKIPANVAPLLPVAISVSALLDDGGQGVVHRGFVNGAPAAIKLYMPGQVETRIEREVAALGQIACRSIVRLLWHGTVQAQGHDLHVVATELLNGQSIKDVLAGGRRLAGDELGVLAFDVAEAIEAMWKRRIVHRDLKPGNVLLRPDSRACVIDLGLARHLNEPSLSAAGTGWGTLGYLSPEQSRCVKALTCHSDVYSLGVLLVEAGMGRHPTGRDQPRLTATAYHQFLPIELAAWPHATLLRSMLEPRPHRRPSPAALVAALHAYHP